MAINYASKYASNIDERFHIGALTEPAVNKDYDFTGVKTVNVYSIPTAAMNDYQRTGASRYGTADELENTVQELTLTQDRSFTFTIDKGNYTETQMANAAGTALQRQIDEVIIPEIDVYRLKNMAAAAELSAAAEITSANAFEAFLDGQAALTDNKVTAKGRVAFVSPTYYKYLKLDDAFIKSGDSSQKMLLNGEVGRADGVPVIVVPSAYMPAGVNFIIASPRATVSPVKLADYKIHDNPPGINGWLIEGRVIYDAFVLTNKAAGIYVHKSV